MKKILSLILFLALAAGLMAACATVNESVSESEPASADAPDTSAVPVTQPTETQTEPTAAELPQDTLETEIRAQLSTMTLREKIAQMCFVTPEALLGVEDAVTDAGSDMKAAFDAYPVGGVILMGQNLTDAAQTKALCAALQEFSGSRLGLPVFIGVDEEGGEVARVSGSGKFGIEAVPGMASVGASGDPAQARAYGETVGGYLSELGFNVDFAPDADVLSNPANTVVKNRSFGTNADLVSSMALAFAEGLQGQGVRACYKHFPGHGATAEDSHKGFAVSDRTLEELWACELKPFTDAALENIPFIMSGHITLPNVSAKDLPASLNYELLTGLLRSEMGYNGIIITDALNMGAVTKRFTQEETAVLAVQAGNDMLLIADNAEAYIAAIESAVQEGEISEDRINASVARILREKLEA